MRSTARVESGRVCSTLSCSCESALITPTSSRARSPVIIYLFMYLFIIFNRCISALTTLPLRVPGARYRMWAYEGLYVFVCVCKRVCIWVFLCVNFVFGFVCARARTHSLARWRDVFMTLVCNMCVCVRVSVSVCLCVCLCRYISTYIFIHT